ncbi:hypothetical protein ACROYT_G042697 [Oculina patagonica]
MGAHLATFETEEKWKNIRKIIKERVAKGDSDYVHWYIGLRKENGTWRFVRKCFDITFFYIDRVAWI